MPRRAAALIVNVAYCPCHAYPVEMCPADGREPPIIARSDAMVAAFACCSTLFQRALVNGTASWGVEYNGERHTQRNADRKALQTALKRRRIPHVIAPIGPKGRLVAVFGAEEAGWTRFAVGVADAVRSRTKVALGLTTDGQKLPRHTDGTTAYAIAAARVLPAHRRAAIDRLLADDEYRYALETAASAGMDATPLVLASGEARR